MNRTNTLQLEARAAGALYLIVIVGCLFAELVARGQLVDYGNAAVTASNLAAHAALYRAGLAADLLACLCYAAITFLFYDVFKGVSKRWSQLAACFGLVGVGVQAALAFFHIAPLLLLAGSGYLNSFDAEQLQTLALFSLKLHAHGYDVALVFFGAYCVVIGGLIFASGFLPRILGILMTFGGLGYLSGSFVGILSPTWSNAISDYSGLPALVGESALCLWLLVKGIDAVKWTARAGAGVRLRNDEFALAANAGAGS